MANNGSFTTSAYNNRSLTFNWSVAGQSSSGNYTDINWNLVGSGNASGYMTSGNFKVVIEDENVYSSSARINLYNGTVIASGSKRIYHNNAGDKSFSASVEAGIYTVAVNCSGSGSWELPTILRYANITTFTVEKVDETSVKVTWGANVACDNVWYSKDNGSSWTEINKYPSFNITGLTVNTSYNFKIRVRRADSQLTSDSGTVTKTTYDYPHITGIKYGNYEIGSSQELVLYNPLSRTVTIKMNKDSASGTQLYSGTTSGTSIIFTPTVSALYASIPNSTSGKCVYSAIYNNSTRTTTGSYTYKIKGTETPIFSTFTYKDVNEAVTTITGNNQVLVKGLSTLQVTIATANKMSTQNSSVAKNYTFAIDNINKSVNYSENDLNITMGSIASAGNKRLTVKAFDSRNLSTTVYKDITIYDYSKPLINANITRLNNFEATTTIAINGSFTRIIIDEEDKNTINSVKYRYKEKNGDWTEWLDLVVTLTDNKFVCDNVILNLDNTKEFEFEIQAIDSFDKNSIASSLGIGEAIFFISTNKKACYINGEKLLTENEIAEKYVTKESIKWTQIANFSSSTATDTTKTIENLAKYNEFLVTVSTSSNTYRVLESSIIPAAMLFGTTAQEGNGTHQIVYGGATQYYGGLSYIGSNQLKIYVGANISVKVFAR